MVGVLAVAAACSRGERLPREWGPLALGEGEECPQVAGRYFDSSEPIAHMLAARFVQVDDPNADWDSFELSQPTADAFTVVVRFADGEERQGRARRGTGPYAGDFYCADGWLQVGDRYMPTKWDAEVRAAGFFPRRRALRIAPGKDGALVARLDLTSYDDFPIWCGDGCRGIPLPWTWETRSSWSAARRWDPDSPSPRAAARVRAEAARRADLAKAKEDPVYREEQALENGPVVAGEGEMRKRGLAALLPGMLLRGVAPRDSGWQLSLEFEELSQLHEFMVRLSQSGPVAEIKVAPLYRARTTTGRWTDVVYVRYETSP